MMIRFQKKSILFLMIVLAILVALPGVALATSGFLTPEPPYVTLDPGVPAGSSVKAILSSGEYVNDFRFQCLPDGI